MNGIFLHLLLREVHDAIVGRYIDAVRVRDRLVQFVLDRKTIIVSLYPQAPAFMLGDNLSGFEKLTKFGDDILSCRITAVTQDDFTPVVRLVLEKSIYGRAVRFELAVSLYKDAPNIRLRSDSAAKQLYDRYIERPARRPITELSEKAIARSGDPAELFGRYEGIDKNLARELDARTLPQLQAVLAGGVYQPRLVSVLPLKISLFADEFIARYRTLNELLNDWNKRFLAARAELEAQAEKAAALKKLKKKLERLTASAASEKDIQDLKSSGDLILANLPRIKRGMSEVELYDHYRQEDAVIRLDPSKSPQENARAYFERYKKAKRGRPVILRQIRDLETRIAGLEKEPSAASAANGNRKTAPGTKPVREKPRPFREFPLPSGSVVYVGKNARSNDNLTFRFARPDDYFFHARSIEGAHAILKAKTPRGQKPSKNDIGAAAAIAAYYSKAREQKKVPVSYTQKKYLKKNKKGKAGSVILMREEVIFVDPGLPV